MKITENIKNCIILFLIWIIFFLWLIVDDCSKKSSKNFPPVNLEKKVEKIIKNKSENIPHLSTGYHPTGIISPLLVKREEATKKNIIEEKKYSENKKLEETKDFCQQFIDKGKYYKVWSETEPKINKTHIFCWEINSRWKASWFHSRRDWINPATAKVARKENENKLGIYTAKIEVFDIRKWEYKQKFSSIFPDNMSIEEIEKAILNAWENKKYYKKSKFRGPSGLGFDIEWYSLKWKINTAYPIYRKK